MSKLTWVVFVFLLTVFALSSWQLTRPQDVYDSSWYDVSDAAELSETAVNGIIARQAALICLGLYAVVTARLAGTRKLHVNGFMGAAFLAYIVWASASACWSTDVALSSKAAVRLLLMCLGALAVSRQLTIRQLAHITCYITATTLAVSLLAEVYWGTFAPLSTLWRLSGVMHPISQGWNCGLLSISALYVSSGCSGAKRLGYQSGMFVGLCFLALTKSRMAFAATLLTMGMYHLWNSTLLQRLAVLAAVGTVVCLALLMMGSRVQHYAAFGREADTEASFGTLTGRIPLWEECLRSLQKRPLCGYGYNAFLSPANLQHLGVSEGWMSSPHSGYIGTLFDSV